MNWVTGQAALEVTQAEIEPITMTPSATSIAKGLTTTITAQAVYSDNVAPQDVTNVVAWSAISADGSGQATITTDGTIKGVAEVVSIAVTPDSASIAKSATQAFTVDAMMTDNSTQSLTTTDIDWTSSDETIASIDTATGIATGAGVGTTTMTATYALNPSISDVGTLEVTPNPVEVEESATIQLTATGHYSDSSSRTLRSLWVGRGMI